MTPQQITVRQARRLYIKAGGPDYHSESEWADIRNEIESIVNAASDRAAGKTILWWGCWDKNYTATAFASRVRENYRRKTK